MYSIEAPSKTHGAAKIYGTPLDILRNGGQFKRNRGCGCSAPLRYSYEDGGMTKACLKGQSCRCTVRRLVYLFVAAQWTYADCESLALDPANTGFEWLRCQDDFDVTLAKIWNGAVKSDPKPLAEYKRTGTPKRAKRSAGSIPKLPKGAFQPDAKLIDTVLRFVIAHPESGTRAIQRALSYRDGHTRDTITLCVERGYLTYELGPNRTHLHSFAAWPTRMVPVPNAVGKVSLTHPYNPELDPSLTEDAESLMSPLSNMPKQDYCYTRYCYTQSTEKQDALHPEQQVLLHPEQQVLPQSRAGASTTGPVVEEEEATVSTKSDPLDTFTWCPGPAIKKQFSLRKDEYTGQDAIEVRQSVADMQKLLLEFPDVVLKISA